MKNRPDKIAMEAFKNIDDVLKPDERWESFVNMNEQTKEIRRVDLEDHYDQVAHISLDTGVPENIATHFLTAKHLWVYSWFVYRFVTVAQLQAYASLEFALRERLRFSSKGKRVGFARLLAMAVEEKLLKDEGFEKIRLQGVGIDGILRAQGDRQHVRTLADVLPKLRNDLAHGSSTLMPDPTLLAIVAEAINQLFRK